MRAGGNHGSLIAGTIIGVVVLGVHMVLALSVGAAYAVPASIAGAIGATVVLRGPLGQALAKRLQSGLTTPDLPPEAVLNELDELRGRISELEERADFSERLLAQHRETPGP